MDVCIINIYMARKMHNFYLDPDLTKAVKAASEGEYMPQGQIVRLALRDWLRTNGYLQERLKQKKGMKKP